MQTILADPRQEWRHCGHQSRETQNGGRQAECLQPEGVQLLDLAHGLHCLLCFHK